MREVMSAAQTVFIHHFLSVVHRELNCIGIGWYSWHKSTGEHSEQHNNFCGPYKLCWYP